MIPDSARVIVPLRTTPPCRRDERRSMERAATRSRFIDSARRFEWSARSALRIARAPSTIEPDTLRKVARDLFAAARRERRRARR